jgi:hypothetical protein
MEINEFPVFGSALEYARKLIYCEVSMREVGYDIHFNNVWKASVAHTVDFTWIQASGAVLPQEIIDEIGFRIKDRYK